MASTLRRGSPIQTPNGMGVLVNKPLPISDTRDMGYHLTVRHTDGSTVKWLLLPDDSVIEPMQAIIDWDNGTVTAAT